MVAFIAQSHPYFGKMTPFYCCYIEVGKHLTRCEKKIKL